jgi:predicted ArsR family transcriptional regulator
VLNELGGLAEIEEHDGRVVIRGYGCPLAAVTPDHPEVCRMAETLLTEVAAYPFTSAANAARDLAAALKWRSPTSPPEVAKRGIGSLILPGHR